MDWIKYLGPPLLMIIGGFITWFFRSYLEELKSNRDKLNIERRKIYLDLLIPYIKILSLPKDKGIIEAQQEITSFEYKKTAFELGLFGSDEVLMSFQDIIKNAVNRDKTGIKNTKEDLFLWGKLFLEIRKSLGNKKTKMTEFDMLRGFIKDIDDYIN
jgi:hypothetical protein